MSAAHATPRDLLRQKLQRTRVALISGDTPQLRTELLCLEEACEQVLQEIGRTPPEVSP